jgi:hypothetical protein
MSIANLLVPNDLNLYCGNLTSSGLVESKTFYRIDFNDVSAQSIPNATITAVQFPSPIQANNFAAPTSNSSVYTAPIAGYYNMSYVVVYQNFTGIGAVYAWITRASSIVRHGASCTTSFEAASLSSGPPVTNIVLGNDEITLTGSAFMFLNLGETFSVNTYQNSGSSQNINATTAGTSVFTINFLHI